MANMSNVKVKMTELDPNIRKTNFEEVAVGYTLEEAKEEARRCLQCKHKPCVSGCPVNVRIPEFIGALAEGNIEEAYEKLSSENKLPAICGRVCPQEKQCEERCVRGIKGEPVGVGRLERFVADYYMNNYESKTYVAPPNGIKVAVVGSGPASMTCAAELAVKGYDVTMFEALHELGGVLVYGIPEFRLPKALVKKEIQKVLDLGVKVHKNVIVGKSITVEDLMSDGFQSIFIGSGAGLPRFMNVPGENLNGVYSANEFLTRVNLMKAYQFPYTDTPINAGDRVAVVGGGNVAMDAARTAKRLGASEVHIIYRRGEAELPARLEEVHHAKEEGVLFDLLTNPVEIIGTDGHVTGLSCVRMTLGEPDASGRRSPIEDMSTKFTIPMDTVIVAIGQTPNPLIKDSTTGLDINRRGCIIVDEESMETSLENVYAGGDVVTGAATVILAMGAGKKAAEAIIAKVNNLA